MPSNHLILGGPLLLPPSIFPSIRVFSNESILHPSWSKCQSFSFSIIPAKETPGLIFRMDWLDLLAVQGILKSLLQHHSSKASILQCSAFFMVQLTSIQNYWKNHTFDQTDLCWQSNVSAFQYAIQVGDNFSSKEQASFNFMAAVIITVILEPKKIKSVIVSILSLFAMK